MRRGSLLRAGHGSANQASSMIDKFIEDVLSA